MKQETRNAAILRRVSTTKQGGESQEVLERWAADRGLTVAKVLTVHDTAWVKRGAKGAEFDAARAEILEMARMGQIKVLLIWALDRASRRGIRDTIGFLEDMHDYGCDVWSHQESWLTTTGDAWKLVASTMAWLAEQESARRSARMTESIAARKAQGRPVGRKAGARDKKPRKRNGYIRSWEEGARREAGGLERDRDEHGRFVKKEG